MQYAKLREKVTRIEESIIEDDGNAYHLCENLIKTLDEMEKKDKIIVEDRCKWLNYAIEKLSELLNCMKLRG